MISIGSTVHNNTNLIIEGYDELIHCYRVVKYQETDPKLRKMFYYPAYGGIFDYEFPSIIYEIPKSWDSEKYTSIKGEDEEYRFECTENFEQNGEILWRAKNSPEKSFVSNIPPTILRKGDADVEIGVKLHPRTIEAEIISITEIYQVATKEANTPAAFINHKFIKENYLTYSEYDNKLKANNIILHLKSIKGSQNCEFWAPLYLFNKII